MPIHNGKDDHAYATHDNSNNYKRKPSPEIKTNNEYLLNQRDRKRIATSSSEQNDNAILPNVTRSHEDEDVICLDDDDDDDDDSSGSNGNSNPDKHDQDKQLQQQQQERVISPPTKDKSNNQNTNNETPFIITRITDADVLRGRGGGIQAHPGNQRIVQIIDALKEEYVRVPRFEKILLTKRVLRDVHQRGGRFIETVDGAASTSSKDWRVMTDQEALKKISQRFRDSIQKDPSFQRYAVQNDHPTFQAGNGNVAGQGINYVPNNHNQRQNHHHHHHHHRGTNHMQQTQARAQVEMDGARMANTTNASRALTPDRNETYNQFQRQQEDGDHGFITRQNNNNYRNAPAFINNHHNGHQMYQHNNDTTQPWQSQQPRSSPATATATRMDKMQRHLIHMQVQAAEAQMTQHQHQLNHQNWENYVELSEKAILLHQKLSQDTAATISTTTGTGLLPGKQSSLLLLENLRDRLLQLEQKLEIPPRKSVASTLAHSTSSCSATEKAMPMPQNGNHENPTERSKSNLRPALRHPGADIETKERNDNDDDGYIATI